MIARRPSPVFIIAAPRSGTTLLRLLLDSHPEIACPGETGMPTLATALVRVWTAICSDIADERISELPPDALSSIRRALRAPMDRYCVETGKRIYCDKSLDAPDNLAAVDIAFPRARHLLLFRHVFDVVASALEVSPYGFAAFGYARYVQHSVSNFVAPLVEHWIACVRAALRWEAAHQSRCHRIRYEDMVAEPTTTFAAVFSFLGADDTFAVDRLLRSVPNHETLGDPKIAYTSAIHTSSVGRGRTIPLELVPPLALAEANELLAILGYPRVTASWNFERSPLGDGRTGVSDGERLKTLMPQHINVDTLSDRTGRLAIVVDDVDTLGWEVDRRSGVVVESQDHTAEITLYGTAAALMAMLLREENPATMIESGRLRLGDRATGRRRSVTRDVASIIVSLQES